MPWRKYSRQAWEGGAELDAMVERIATMRDLLQRCCTCTDLDECGRK